MSIIWEGQCMVRPLNILRFLFYIQKQKKPNHSLSFLFLFKILPVQNRCLCKMHHFIEFLVRTTYPYLHSKKNVKIFKTYQNCRNDFQFNSSLRKKKKPSSFFIIHFTNEVIQKCEKQKSTSVFRFSFYAPKKE